MVTTEKMDLHLSYFKLKSDLTLYQEFLSLERHMRYESDLYYRFGLESKPFWTSAQFIKKHLQKNVR